MKEKPLKLQRCFVLHLGRLNITSIVTGLVFSLRELNTDLKNTGFHFLNLGKTTGFCSETYIVKYFFEIHDF